MHDNTVNQEDCLVRLRAELGELDEQFLCLLEQRQRLAEQIYACKAESGTAVFDAQQEARKISRLSERLAADDQAAARALLQTLMRVSREAQYRLALEKEPIWKPGSEIALARATMPDYKVVAVQGSAYSYAAEAAKALFPRAGLLPSKSFESACRQVVEEMVDVCVLPLENSSAGTVDDAYALLEKYNLYIVATKNVEIQHCLAALPGVTLADIRTVVSHPQALAQCSTIIKGMGWTSEELQNTAFAAERVALLGDKSRAAIASEAATRQFGLQVISHDITNQLRNQTRFVAVSREPVILPTANKLSLIVRLSHQSGSLARVLALLADWGLNLSKLQSLPLPQFPWQYSFYVDVESAKTPAALRALYQLAQEQPFLKFLGWYEG